MVSALGSILSPNENINATSQEQGAGPWEDRALEFKLRDQNSKNESKRKLSASVQKDQVKFLDPDIP